MLRRSTRTTPLYAIALAAMVLALFAAPAAAHKEGTGGKPAVGEVVSFDGTTLTVAMNDGSSFSGAVAEDVQVKVEHRGHKEHGKGHKKPSNGSVADLTAGAKVLRMKVKCGEVQKLRLRRAPAVTTVVTDPVVVDPVAVDPVLTTSEEVLETEEVETEEVETETDDDGCSDEVEDVEVEDVEGDASDLDDEGDDPAEL